MFITGLLIIRSLRNNLQIKQLFLSFVCHLMIWHTKVFMKTVKITNSQRKTRVFCGIQSVSLNNLSTLTILTGWMPMGNVLRQIYLLTCRKFYNSIGKYYKLYIDSTKLINSKTIIINVQ